MPELSDDEKRDIALGLALAVLRSLSNRQAASPTEASKVGVNVSAVATEIRYWRERWAAWPQAAPVDLAQITTRPRQLIEVGDRSPNSLQRRSCHGSRSRSGSGRSDGAKRTWFGWVASGAAFAQHDAAADGHDCS